MSRQEKLLKLQRAIVAYRGITVTTETGKTFWKHPPKKQYVHRLKTCFERLGLVFDKTLIDGFKSLAEMRSFVSTLDQRPEGTSRTP